MRRLCLLGLMVLVALPLWAQAAPEKWTVGTVMAIKPHVAPASDSKTADSPPSFEVTVRVGRTDYVVLYTEVPGAPAVEYAVGRDAPVLIGRKTLSFRDKLGRKVDLPILSRTPAGAPAKAR